MSDSVREEAYRIIFLDATITHLLRADVGLLFSAYYLDPNYRAEWLTTEGRLLVGRTVLKMCIDMNLIQPGEPGRNGTMNLFGELRRYEEELKRTKPGSRFDIRDFWASKPCVYLKVLGRRLSYLHASSANTERYFSAMNRTITCDRNRMHRATLFNLMSVRIHTLSKQQNRVRALLPSSADLFNNSAEGPLLEEADPMEALSIDGGIDFIESSKYRNFMQMIDFTRSVSYHDQSGEDHASPSKRDSGAHADELIELIDSQDGMI